MTEWLIEENPVPYDIAMTKMAQRVEALKNQTAQELVWCLEHPSVYTYGTGVPILADDNDKPLIQDKSSHQVITNRGGQATWHGLGQRVCYVMIDLAMRKPDPHLFVRELLSWAGSALAELGIASFVPQDKDKIGLWVKAKDKNKTKTAHKIVAVGVRLSSGRGRLITSHGIAINLNPDLSAFDKIIPCGITDPQYGVSSVWAEGVTVSMAELDLALKKSWYKNKFFDLKNL